MKGSTMSDNHAAAATPGSTPVGQGLYVPPFEYLKREIRVSSRDGRVNVEMEYDYLMKVVKSLLWGVPVDEAWYLRQYPDVAQAVEAGAYRSARQHFVENGYFEGRLPQAVEIDPVWYVKAYEDVAEGLASGLLSSAEEHFETHGRIEGRLPFPV